MNLSMPNEKRVLTDIRKPDVVDFHNSISKWLINEGDEFKRGDIKRAPTQGVSDIIPLKFQAVVDGIGGIVIGSTFKINESRLPIVYRKTKGRQILFICMTEEQNITARKYYIPRYCCQR